MRVFPLLKIYGPKEKIWVQSMLFIGKVIKKNSTSHTLLLYKLYMLEYLHEDIQVSQIYPLLALDLQVSQIYPLFALDLQS